MSWTYQRCLCLPRTLMSGMFHRIRIQNITLVNDDNDVVFLLWFKVGECGEQKKPEAWEVLSECVFLTQAQPQSQGEMASKAFPLICVWMLIVYAGNVHPSFVSHPSWIFVAWRLLSCSVYSYQDWLSLPPSLFICNNPSSLFNSLFKKKKNKHAEPLGFCGFCIQKPNPHNY